MPAYNANIPVALCQGFAVALVNNAATDSGITSTQQVAIAPVPNQSGTTIMITNTTNQTATGQFAPTDALTGSSSGYKPLSGCTIPAGTTLAYNLSGGWINFTFASAPTSGSLVVSR